MAEYQPPVDLLETQREFYAADAEVRRLEAGLPSAADIVAGVAAISDGQHEELLAARDERGRILDKLYAPHEWWDTVEDRLAARRALQKAARESSPAGG